MASPPNLRVTKIFRLNALFGNSIFCNSRTKPFWAVPKIFIIHECTHVRCTGFAYSPSLSCPVTKFLYSGWRFGGHLNCKWRCVGIVAVGNGTGGHSSHDRGYMHEEEEEEEEEQEEAERVSAYIIMCTGGA